MVFNEFVSDFAERLGKRKSYALTALLSIPFIIAYFYYVIRYSVNFPYLDDYFTVLTFVTAFVKSHSILEKAGLFLVQNNEHRIVFTKAAALLQYYLCGGLNFKLLTLIGNTGLLFIWCLFFKEAVLKQRGSVLLMAPVTALLFNFGIWEISFWAEGSLGNIWIVVLALASIYFYFQESRGALLLSVLIAMLATFSSGNGMFVFFSVLLIVVLQKKMATRKTMVWIISAVVIIALFFYKYQVARHPGILQNFSLLSLGHMIVYYLVFIGNTLSINIYISIATGVFIVLLVLCGIYKKFYIAQPVLSAWVVFFLCTGGAAMISRFEMEVYQANSSRYAINSVVLLIALFMIYGIEFKSQLRVWHLTACFVFVALINGWNSRNKMAPIKNAKTDFDFEYALSTAQRLSNFNYRWIDAEKVYPRNIIKDAEKEGVFSFPGADARLLLDKIPEDTAQQVKFDITMIRKVPGYDLTIGGWGFLPGQASDSVNNFMYLINARDSLVEFMVPDRTFNNHVVKQYDGGVRMFKHSGFELKLDIERIPPGPYHILLVTTNSHIKTIRDAHINFEAP